MVCFTAGHENGRSDSFGKGKVAAEESKQGLYGNIIDFTAMVVEWRHKQPFRFFEQHRWVLRDKYVLFSA